MPTTAHRLTAPLAGLLLAVLLLVGCAEDTGQDEDPEPQPGSEPVAVVEVRAVEIGPYEDAPDEVPSGTIRFVLVNEDPEFPHDFIIEELDVGTDVIEPGETDDVTVELDPGTYTYYCSVPGHRAAGMEGTFEATS